MKIFGMYMGSTMKSGREWHQFCALAENFPEDQELEYIGNNFDGKTNADIDKVSFSYCTMTRIPQGITKTFANLKHLEISNSNLKWISKNDLAEFKNLEQFNFRENEIMYLPGDLFEGFNNLKSINFYSNHLILINPNILNGLNKLETVDFRGNLDYDKCFSRLKLKYKNATLEEVKLDLLEKFYLPILGEFFKNNIKVENLNLFDISKEIFEIILRFIKMNELPGENGTNYLHLFAGAGKLRIQKLKDYAAGKLMNRIDIENSVDILNLANKYDHEELRQKAFEQIKKKYPNVEFKDECSVDTEELEKAIETVKQKEEADTNMEEEFKKLIN